MTVPVPSPRNAPSHQPEALFDIPEPPIRKGAADYLSHLGALRYHDEIRREGWTFWALAPFQRSWLKPAPVAAVEHVWLVLDRQLYQALVDIQTGEILRRRHYATMIGGAGR